MNKVSDGWMQLPYNGAEVNERSIFKTDDKSVELCAANGFNEKQRAEHRERGEEEETERVEFKCSCSNTNQLYSIGQMAFTSLGYFFL